MAYKLTGIAGSRYGELTPEEQARVQAAGDAIINTNRSSIQPTWSAAHVAELMKGSEQSAQEAAQRAAEGIFTAKSDALRLAEKAKETGQVTIGDANTIPNLQASGQKLLADIPLPAGSAGEANRINLGTHNTSIAANANLPPPTFTPVGGGVPTGTGGSTYTAPQQNSSNIVESYYQGITQSVANLSTQLEQERQRNLDRIQADKQRASDELQNTRDMQADAINEGGKLSIEEKQKKLDALDLETKRFDENYAIVQGLGTQLMDLMSQGNALIASQKGVTGLGVIRNPRVAQTINNITAQVGVLKAGIDVFNGQMGQAQNQLQLATSTLTSAYSDQIDYYKSIANFYESVASDNNAEVVQLTKDERAYMDSKITSLEADRQRVMDNADAIADAMTDPDTALAYASAGVTLNDAPEVIMGKLAKYGYSKELADQSNDFAQKGYTALVSGNPPAGSEVVRVIDSQGKVKTYWKKEKGTTPSPGETKSDVDTYAQAYFDEEISLTSIPQNIRASVIAKANKIAADVLAESNVPAASTTPAGPSTPITSYGAGKTVGSAAISVGNAVKTAGTAIADFDVAGAIGNFFKGLGGF